MVYQKLEDDFFDLVVHDLNKTPGFTGVCAGFEANEWRYEPLRDYLFNWLMEFALTYSELKKLNHLNAYDLLKKSAKLIYQTEKYSRRGEFGEIILHALIREIFNSEPAISKIYYKSASNETVKGFDAVHIVKSGRDLELWLGEVKFYKTISKAIEHVIIEIRNHTKNDYLKNEFIMIDTKIDQNWHHSSDLKKIIATKKSLDTVFSRICIPVLLTYESPVVQSAKLSNQAYQNKISQELNKHYKSFISKLPPKLKIRIHLFLFPIKSKKQLIFLLNEKLKSVQA